MTLKSGGSLSLVADVLVFPEELDPEGLPFGDIGAGEGRFIDPLETIVQSARQELTAVVSRAALNRRGCVI